MNNTNNITTRTIRIATRKSELALWQANHVANLLQKKYKIKSELVPVVTKGDRILDIPLAKIGGKGLFLKEIEETILNNEADIAVHSMKDVPTTTTNKLIICAMLTREDPSDALIGASSIESLPKNAIIGTSSLRRQSQIIALRPDIKIKTLRGNVNTRLAKLHAHEYDAIILATIGLLRINLGHHIGQRLKNADMLPAVAQGCIGIQCRTEDTELREILKPLEDPLTALAITAERYCNEMLGGSCHAPIGIHGTWQKSNQLILEGMVGNLSGTICKKSMEATITTQEDAIQLGQNLANLLFESGARQLLTQ